MYVVYPAQTEPFAKWRAHTNGLRVLAWSDVRLAKSTLAVHSRVRAGVCGFERDTYYL